MYLQKQNEIADKIKSDNLHTKYIVQNLHSSVHLLIHSFDT